MLNNKPYHKNLKRHKNDKQYLQTITATNNIALTCSALALKVVITKRSTEQQISILLRLAQNQLLL